MTNQEDLYEDDFNQFYILKYKSRLQAELCILQDVCFLKKNQEVDLNKAYHDCTNLQVIIACQDAKVFFGLGTVCNEPSELIYLNEDSKKVVNIDQLKEQSYFSFIKVKWILKGILNFDLVNIVLQDNQKLSQSKEIQEIPAQIAKQFQILFQKEAKPFKKEATLNNQSNIIMGMPKNFPQIMPFAWGAPNNMMMNFGSFMGNGAQVKNEPNKIKASAARNSHSPDGPKEKQQEKRKKKSPSETRRRRSVSSKISSKEKRNSKRSPKRTQKKSPIRKSPVSRGKKRSAEKRSPVRRSPVKKVEKRSPKVSPKRKEKGKKREEGRKAAQRSRSRNSAKERSLSKQHIKNGKKHKTIEQQPKKTKAVKVEQQREILFNNDRLSSESMEPKKESKVQTMERSIPQDLNGIEDGQINELLSLQPKSDKKQHQMSTPSAKYDIQIEEDLSKMKPLPLVRTHTEETPTKSMKIIKSGKVLFTTGSISNYQGGKGIISIQRSNAAVPSLSSRLIVKKQ